MDNPTWRGPVPPDIEPGAAPGGLVAVHRSTEDRELRRWPLDSLDRVEDIAESNRELVVAVGGSIVLYDGDTGAPVCRLGFE